MFDILFDCELIEWTPEGIPVPLIEFIETSEDSDDA
jgi:hypothetical protein